jgi:hypothetical protein
MVTITPIENGLHSLAKGLEAFNSLHNNPSDAFALKDAILRTHHAVETLIKAALFEINPVFVLKDETKIGKFVSKFQEFVEGKNSFIIDNEYTIGLIDAINRLHNLGKLSEYPEREFYQIRSALMELEVFRNAIQHFAINAKMEIVARILGNIIPRFMDLLEVLSRSRISFFGYGYSPIQLPHKTLELSEFRKKLNTIYPESEKIINLLRHRYDELISKTIEFFSGREFQETEISVRVRDHGKVGCPPYMPEITLKGALEIAVDAHQLLLSNLPFDNVQQFQITNYEGSVIVANPVKKGNNDFNSIVTGSIELQANIILPRSESAILLAGAEEFVPMLRDIDIGLTVSLHYEAIALYNQAHYDVRNILEAQGELKLIITAVPTGYDNESKKHMVNGSFSSSLDKQNAPFKLHAFVEPDGTLSNHRILDWTINTKSVLRFEK